jgi:hypothetical protein
MEALNSAELGQPDRSAYRLDHSARRHLSLVETATATFWLDEGIMDDLQNGHDWEAYIWRTDTWLEALGPVPLPEQGALNKGDFWI